MDEPKAGEWPWLILHKGHPAWYQRALMAGDMAPGKTPIPNYVLNLDGTFPPPDQPPVCGRCKTVPKVEELDIVERMTGRVGFLAWFRAGRKEWPRGTNPNTCWYCNNPMKRCVPYRMTVEKKAYDIKICESCREHLDRERRQQHGVDQS